MESTSKIRVYTAGIEKNGVGAYAYAVLEVTPGMRGGDVINVRSRFAQAGPCKNDLRMKMRAFYEGIRHCPDGTEPEVLSDCYPIKEMLYNTNKYSENGDIAERFRQYILEHNVRPSFCLTDIYAEDDLPCDGHQECTWMVNNLCEEAIERYNETKRSYAKSFYS